MKIRIEEEKESTAVNPKHYSSHPSGIECIEIAKHMNFCLGNAFKYVFRHKLKDVGNQILDLKKALWYLQCHVESLSRGPSIRSQYLWKGQTAREEENQDTFFNTWWLSCRRKYSPWKTIRCIRSSDGTGDFRWPLSPWMRGESQERQEARQSFEKSMLGKPGKKSGEKSTSSDRLQRSQKSGSETNPSPGCPDPKALYGMPLTRGGEEIQCFSNDRAAYLERTGMEIAQICARESEENVRVALCSIWMAGIPGTQISGCSASATKSIENEIQRIQSQFGSCTPT